MERNKFPMQDAVRVTNALQAVENGKPETPGQTWGRLVRQTVEHTLALAANRTDPQGEAYQRAQEGLLTAREEFDRRFPVRIGDGLSELRPKLFGDIVRDRIDRHYRKQKEEEKDKDTERVVRDVLTRKRGTGFDWDLIRQEFPGQYEEPDYEHQAAVGDVPPTTIFVNKMVK